MTRRPASSNPVARALYSDSSGRELPEVRLLAPRFASSYPSSVMVLPAPYAAGSDVCGRCPSGTGPVAGLVAGSALHFAWVNSLVPFLGSLVRVACSCRRWRRAVASSPEFRLRFNALHPAPPLLSLFFDTAGSGWYLYQQPCVPAFVPIRHSDREFAAATSSLLPSMSSPTRTTSMTAAAASFSSRLRAMT